MKKRSFIMLILILINSACASSEYSRTVSKVDLKKFLKKWYVIAGRFTFLEQGAHNAVEEYKFNEIKQRIDIDFYFNLNSFDGPLKKIPQKAWIHNSQSNAHWKVSPFWPLKFDYLIVDLDDDYSWTVIGVPSQKYLWIMADHWNIPESKLQEIISRINSLGYAVNDIIRIPQKWPATTNE